MNEQETLLHMNERPDDVIAAMRTGASGYFAFTLLWSAGFWLASPRWGGGLEPGSSPLFLIGGAGPLIGALLLLHTREPSNVRRDFWSRVVDPRRMRWPWWVAALLLHPAIVGMAVVVDLALGGTIPSTEKWPASFAALLGLAFFTFWFGPLPEEMGWRGFALDRLQRRINPVSASVILGIVWALWHVPLFFVPDTFQAGIGFGSPRFWIFLYSMVPLSVLMTWVYNNTSRSTLSAALIHYTGNLCGALIPKSDQLAGIEAVLLTIAALGVAWRMTAPAGTR